MNRCLSQQQVTQYERDGVFFPVQALTGDEVARFRSALEAMEAKLGGNLKRIDNSHLFFSWAYDLVTHHAILDAVESLVGPDILVHSSRIFYKHPHTSDYVSWHQDGRYSGLNAYSAHTAWVALSDSAIENGCLRVISGSHKQGVHPRIERCDSDNLERNGQMVAVDESSGLIRNVILKAGEFSLHHINMVHGSQPNLSDYSRIGFAITFIAPQFDAHFKRHMFVLARGRCQSDQLQLLKEPPAFDLQEAIARHAEFVRQREMSETS